MCVYLDDGITREDALELLASWDSEAPMYGLYINPLSFEAHPRAGFFHTDIMSDVTSIPLREGCDRVLYFVNRTAWDYLYASFPNPVLWPMPEVLGETDDDTMTHSFVVAKRDGLIGLWLSPYSVTRHELYHLLGGCPHALLRDRCYERIAELKRRSPSGFFPSWSSDGQLFTTREQVNDALASAVELPPLVASARPQAP